MAAVEWSGSDFPYMCLKDHGRTLALRKAIHATVRTGDVVVDIGAGTGVLSMFAVEAGAARVIAVEADPLLARDLSRTVQLNGLDERIDVVCDDARTALLPAHVNVVLAEIIETGLVDESLIPVLNSLYFSGTIGPSTLLVPAGYETWLTPCSFDDRLYGYRFACLRHEWPHYAGPEWEPFSVTALGEPRKIWACTFQDYPIDEYVEGTALVRLDPKIVYNGVRLSGQLVLASGSKVGAFPSLNGDKFISLSEISRTDVAFLQYRYRMGGGMETLDLSWSPTPGK